MYSPAGTSRIGMASANFAQSLSTLSPSLSRLVLRGSFVHDLTSLPPFLTHLDLGLIMNHHVTLNNLPSSLLSLTMHKSNVISFFFDQLPQSLSVIKFSATFNGNIDLLPNSVQDLTFGDSFNQKVDHLPLPNASYFRTIIQSTSGSSSKVPSLSSLQICIQPKCGPASSQLESAGV
jgi:FNIP Repeat